jgi:hypothetical protein
VDCLFNSIQINNPSSIVVARDGREVEGVRTFPIPLKGRPGPHACIPNSTASRVVFTRSLPWSSCGNMMFCVNVKWKGNVYTLRRPRGRFLMCRRGIHLERLLHLRSLCRHFQGVDWSRNESKLCG